MPASELAEWALAHGDPIAVVTTLVTTLLLAGYIRFETVVLRRDVGNLRDRVGRLETKQMRADGGEPE